MTNNRTGILRCRPRRWRPGLCMCLTLSMALLVQGAPPSDPLPVPEYSFAVGSPSVDQGFNFTGDILELDFPHPATSLSSTDLGLWSHLDDIDALSAGNVSVATPDMFALLFSVDSLATGAVAPDLLLIKAGVPYNVQDQVERGHAAGDQFFSTESFSKLGQLDPLPGAVLRNNFLNRNNFNEGGTDFSGYPPTHGYTKLKGQTPQDRVNATARLTRYGPEERIEHLYFSLSPESPSLEMLSSGWEASGSHIFFAFDPAAMYGACCFGDSTCEPLTETECSELSGQWLGAFAPCEICGGPRGAEGACCIGDGACSILDEADCNGASGVWLGPVTTCDMCDHPPPSEAGACCFNDDTCDILDEFTCWDAQGVWLGPETTCGMCEELPPMDTGVCCKYDAECEILTEPACFEALGFWLGSQVTCDLCENLTGSEGACCFEDGTCEILDEYTCWGAWGLWQGPDSTCERCEEQDSAMIVVLYASHTELGLVQADNIDAMIVFDSDEDGWFGGEDLVLFSLAPDSPSLDMIEGASMPGAAADVFAVRPGSPPTVFAAAEELGLGAPTDNIDALDLHISAGKSRQIAQHGIRLLPGDMNSDGNVSAADITPFVTALCSPFLFADLCPKGNWNNADSNCDGHVNGADIAAFIELLLESPKFANGTIFQPMLLNRR